MSAARQRQIPEWARDPQLQLSSERVDTWNHTEFSQNQRLLYQGHSLNVDIVLVGDSNVHYQLRRKTWPEDLGTWPRDFQNLLSQVVEEHFGSVDDFRVENVHELRQWGLLAVGVRTRPLFRETYYYEDFLVLLDRVLTAVEAQ